MKNKFLNKLIAFKKSLNLLLIEFFFQFVMTYPLTLYNTLLYSNYKGFVSFVLLFN